jgi:hypothetical protein
MTVHFRVGEIDDAAVLITQHHYSGRMAGNVQCVGSWHLEGGLFGDRGEIIAACVFSIPPTRWNEEVLELTRLCRRPDVRLPLTGLIAATVKHISRKKYADLLVSFADRTQNHHGGIYQAASWSYDGCRDRRMDGVMIDSVFIPGRSCNSKWGTQSPDRLRERLQGHTVEAHYDEGKHLYWRSLSRTGKKKAVALGLEALPYPKPFRPDPGGSNAAEASEHED